MKSSDLHNFGYKKNVARIKSKAVATTILIWNVYIFLYTVLRLAIYFVKGKRWIDVLRWKNTGRYDETDINAERNDRRPAANQD